MSLFCIAGPFFACPTRNYGLHIQAQQAPLGAETLLLATNCSLELQLGLKIPFFLHVITTSQQGATHQCTEEIHSLQHQFLVSDPSQAQLLQVLVGDLQQLFPADLFAFEVAHVRLEAVVQPWTTQNKEGKRGGLIRQTKRTDQFNTLQLTTAGAPWLWANASQLQGLPPSPLRPQP